MNRRRWLSIALLWILLGITTTGAVKADSVPTIREYISSSNNNVIKLRAYSGAIWFEGEGWTDWKECNILIVMDFNRERISIHAEDLQEYDITEVETYNEQTSHFRVEAVDQDGDLCTVEMYGPKYPEEGYTNQLYIRFSNVQWCYNFRLL